MNILHTTWKVRPVGSLSNPSPVTVNTGEQSDSPTSVDCALRMKSSMVQRCLPFTLYCSVLDHDSHTTSGSGQLFRFLDIFNAFPWMTSRRPSRSENEGNFGEIFDFSSDFGISENLLFFFPLGWAMQNRNSSRSRAGALRTKSRICC